MKPFLLRRLFLPLLMMLSVLLAGHPVGAWASPGSLCGVVFADRHGDGQCGSDDTLLCGVTLTLKNSAGAACGTAVTDGYGKYAFSCSKSGTYTVCAPPTCGGLPVCAYSGTVCITLGQCCTKNFCYQYPGSVCGVVTTSCGGDSPCSSSDAPICGVPVTIKDSTGAQCGTATTDGSGKYACNNLKPGSYTVSVPATYNGLPVCAYSGAVCVASCQCTTKNLCYQGPGSVGGLVFQDTNGTCLYNFCDPLLSGVPVALVDTSGKTVATTTTNCFGLYLFCSVAPGCYTIKVPQSFCGLVPCACDLAVTVTSCQTACKFLCYQCPPPVAGLSITAAVSHGCIPAGGGTIPYTYVVTNTGGVTVNAIAITDSVWGKAGTIATLAPGKSASVSNPVTLTAAQVAQYAGAANKITSAVTASGTSAAGNVAVTSPASAPVAITVIHPGLSLTITPNPGTAGPGDTVAFTYTVTNTGDIAIDNITVKDGGNNTLGVIAQLAPNASSQPLTGPSVTIPAGTTGSYSVSGSAAGADDCGQSPVSATGSGTVVVKPHAKITGRVTCDDTDALPIVGAAVQLLDGSSHVVASTATVANGVYTFTGIADGSYTVQVTDAPDWYPNSGVVTGYAHTGGDYAVNTILLTPTPVPFLAAGGAFLGNVYFSNSAGFSGRDTSGHVALTETDLYDTRFVSADKTLSYKYIGYLPGFPELGHFGDASKGEPQMWVIVVDALRPENVWSGISFTNLVGVSPAVTNRADGDYLYRFLFSEVNQGPGTAYNYTLSGVNVSPASSITPSVNVLAPVLLGQMPVVTPTTGTPEMTFAGTTVPGNTIARGRGQYTNPPNTNMSVSVDGSYQNACGDAVTFNVCPVIQGIDIP